eukprot:10195410-Alexandrium_andersonii.AAC.1
MCIRDSPERRRARRARGWGTWAARGLHVCSSRRWVRRWGRGWRGLGGRLLRGSMDLPLRWRRLAARGCL